MMKLQYTAFLTIGLMAFQAVAQDQNNAAPNNRPATPVNLAPAVPEMPDMESVSYCIGLTWGATLKRNAPEANIDTIAKGIRDVVAGNPVRFNDQERNKILQNFQIAYQAQMAAKNKKEGEEFLAKNSKEKGVVTLPSGLQYQVLTEGTGPTPAATDTVTVNYRGSLLDGTEFDSSAKHNTPFTFMVSGGIIKGWSEAIQLMKVGSKWKVFIPANLAYGERSNGAIQPNSTLIFEIELLSIKEPTPAAATTSGTTLSGDIVKVPSAEDLKKGAQPEIIKVAPATK